MTTDASGLAGAAPAPRARLVLPFLRITARFLAPLCLGLAGGLGLVAVSGAGGPVVHEALAREAWPWALLASLLLYGLAFIAGRRASPHIVPGVARLSPGAGGVSDLLLPDVIAAFPDPCVAVDRRGVVLVASPATAQLFPTIMTGRPLAFALRAPEFVEALEAVLNGGARRTVLVTQRVPVERTFEVVATPLDEGRRRGALVVLRDLTAQQRVEQMRVDFIANASHELRTPLATVMGFIETLQGPARDDAHARERFLVIMREQSLRMKRLIDDLLSLSRIEGRAHHAPSMPVDMVEVARQIADSLGPMASAAGVEIVFSAPETPLIVAGDRDELLRVVENLVENAVKYGGAGKRVELSVAASPQAEAGQDGGLPVAGVSPREALLSVRDFGPGVAAEDVPRLTERFYRVGAIANMGKTGSGLGLAIVKHIVTRHRGRMQIDSAPDAGATFRIALPLARSPALGMASIL